MLLTFHSETRNDAGCPILVRGLIADRVGDPDINEALLYQGTTEGGIENT